MIRIYPADKRYSAQRGWLECNFSFSFADYYDPENMSFGPLRVFNDDYIQPQNGFGTHPHRDMEIVTFVLSGQLEHKDNTGGHEVLRPGEVQRMSAGTGVLHSEINNSPDQVTNSLQLWFLPERKGIAPSYEQRPYDEAATRNALLPVVSSKKGQPGFEDAVFIHQDLTLYMSRLEKGRRLDFAQKEGRLLYLFLIEGSLQLTGETGKAEENRRDTAILRRRDAARMSGLTALSIEAEEDAHFMLMDLPS